MAPISADSFMTVHSALSPHEIKIKGSRFIGQVFHIESKEEFDLVYRKFQKKYTRASHYCYAYRISSNLYHYHDDGEPGGTAGKPIYHVLHEQDLYQVLLIVARYFGGTKLGRNGLVRAYTQTAQETLQKTERVPKIFYRYFRLQVPYVLTENILQLVRRYEGMINQAEYMDRVTFLAQIPEVKYSDFKKELNILAHKDQLEYELIEIV
jgi:uncharacterized YigZ family protein